MNFAEADYVMTNTPGMLRAMGQMMTDLGVRPEIEVFETGHLWFAKQLVEEGIIQDPVMIQMCMGIPWGAPDDLNTFMAMVNNTPANWTFSAFSIGRNEMPFAAAAVLAGGNVSASASKTTCGWKKACSPPMHSWLKKPRPSSPTWARP